MAVGADVDSAAAGIGVNMGSPVAVGAGAAGGLLVAVGAVVALSAAVGTGIDVDPLVTVDSGVDVDTEGSTFPQPVIVNSKATPKITAITLSLI